MLDRHTVFSERVSPKAAGNVDTHHPLDMPGTPSSVIDETAALEQCGDWMLVAELLQDILAEGQAGLSVLRAAQISDDQTRFWQTAHAIKSSALNLHLPALAEVSQRAEVFGRQMEQGGRQQSDLREALIEALKWELDQLRRYIPTAQERVRQQLQAGGKTTS